MVISQRELHERTDNNGIFLHHRLLLYLTYGQDAGLRLVDDSRKAFDIKHSQIADGKGSAGQFIGIQFVFLGPCGQILADTGNFRKGHKIGVPDYGNKKPVVRSYSHSDVYIILCGDILFIHGGIHHGEFGQCLCGAADYNIIVAYPDVGSLKLLAENCCGSHIYCQAMAGLCQSIQTFQHSLGYDAPHAADGDSVLRFCRRLCSRNITFNNHAERPASRNPAVVNSPFRSTCSGAGRGKNTRYLRGHCGRYRCRRGGRSLLRSRSGILLLRGCGGGRGAAGSKNGLIILTRLTDHGNGIRYGDNLTFLCQYF